MWPYTGVFMFERVNDSQFLRTGLAGKALTHQPIQGLWVGHLVVWMGILAAKVLGQASLVPESVGGQAWKMGTGTSLMTGSME